MAGRWRGDGGEMAGRWQGDVLWVWMCPPMSPTRVPGAAGVCTRLLGWGRGDICMRVCSPNRVSAAVPTLDPPSPHVPMHGGGCGVTEE